MRALKDKSSQAEPLERGLRSVHHESCGPSLLAAIPFFVIGLLSAMSPELFTAPRLLATLALFAAAAALAVRGWPRRRSVVVDRAGKISTANGRLLLNQIARLSLVAIRKPNAESSDYRFQLCASDGQGKRCLLFSAADPGLVFTRARLLSEFLAIRVDVALEFLGGTVATGLARGQADAVPVHELLARLPRFPRYATWLAWGGCLFVWSLSASLLRAHFARDGTVSQGSWLLFAMLCGMGLLLPHWALGTRLGMTTAEDLATTGKPPGPSFDVTLDSQGLFGARRLARWGPLTHASSLLCPGIGGHWYLLVTNEPKTQALRLAVPPYQGDGLASSYILR